MLVPLSVFISSLGDGGPLVSVFLMTLHLLSDQPAGGFLAVGDGSISMEELGLFALSPSSQLEVKHQQCVSSHLLQYSQYLPEKFVSCFTSPSKMCGGLLNSKSVGVFMCEEFSTVCTLAAMQGILPFLDFI